MRAAALERDGNACTLCGRIKGEDGEALQVHHLKYRERLEDGILEDVTLVLTYPALRTRTAKADVRGTIGVRSGTLLDGEI